MQLGGVVSPVVQQCLCVPRYTSRCLTASSARHVRLGNGVRAYVAVAERTAPTIQPPPSLPVAIDTLERQDADYRAIAQEMLSGQRENVASLDSKKFREHWSVDFWRNYQLPQVLSQSSNSSVLEKVQFVLQQMTKAGVFANGQSAAYWSYCVLRTSVLASQGVASVLAAQAAAQTGQRSHGPGETVTGGRVTTPVKTTPAAPANTPPEKSEDAADRFVNLIRWGLSGPLWEAFTMYGQDYQNIASGVYKLPWDMTTRGHRQWNPLWVLQTGVDYVRQAVFTLQRSARKQADALWMTSKLYPDYYMNSFHYQTDGWLSPTSASVYEASTETLFLGRQDAMQRQTLVPVAEHMRTRGALGAAKIIDVAAGTGRFATFIKDNHPAAEVSVLELSPFYLQNARDNMAEWLRLKDPQVRTPPSLFMQAAVEKMPSPDNTYDALTCIYLFHELPPEARKQAAREMARVVKPGGVVVITDSVQLGDRPDTDKGRHLFGGFNEPFYESFIVADLGAIFEEAGLKPDQKIVGSVSKTLSFRKPMQA